MNHTEKNSSHTVVILKSLHMNWDIKNQHLIFSSKFTLGPTEMDLRDESITIFHVKLLISPSTSNKCMKHANSKSSCLFVALRSLPIV